MLKVKGIAVSAGVAVGKVYYIGKEELSIPKKKVSHAEIPGEIYRLEEALIETRKQINQLQKQISSDLGFENAKIFEAHILVLEDRVLIEDIILQIKNRKINVEFAFWQSIQKYVETLRKLDDDYLRERVTDIEDVARRVIRHLLKQEFVNLQEVKEKVIIVAHDITPSEAAVLPKEHILALVTEVGGRTSHTAIISRSLGIPAVVGINVGEVCAKQGETIIVDGYDGIVVVNPTDRSLKEYQQKSDKFVKERKTVPVPKAYKSKTTDGRVLTVSGNIEFPEEIALVCENRAEGIGLYRTEYMFLGRNEFPTEEEQYRAYQKVAKNIKPQSVIIRTMDIGGDKVLPQIQFSKEMTPFLGWRAIRFCLARSDVFKPQLRAILRAAVDGDVKIMFPMISGLEELQAAKKVLEECKKELKAEGKKFKEDISVGTMIEIPSAVLVADHLAAESDFFSIGTNDLIQYTLAVDRVNEKVAYLYEPGHPAVLRLIKQTIDAAHRNKIWAGMCGEMASDPLFVFVLIGLGLDEFSVLPLSVPKVKELIRQVSFEESKKIAEKALLLGTAKEVEKFLKSELKKILKNDYEKILRG
ncbi:MAG: phosphoenolpyruvate--protein phosphotransferase [Candidatus Omnitrophica bacterium]|nr:phosphoenolpyruvate--protein phosphotransferase [Candidatus Omnitrophota bacterium]